MRARLKVSRAGVELIKSFEGLRTSAARLPDGRWTLGYGHTFSARDGATVTQEDADALLRFDLLPIVDSINNLILVPVNQNQFDALVSFCFNIGVDNFAASGVLKRINEGRMTEAALAMDSWRSAEFNGQTYVLAPLIRRRAAEKNLFLTPEEITGNAPSLLIRPVEDAAGEGTRPTEVNAPDRNGILSAHPLNTPEPVAAPVAYSAPEPVLSAPYAQPAFTPAPIVPVPAENAPVERAPASYSPPFEISATPQPVPTPAPVASPVSPPGERQMIDLTAFAPRPVEPVETPPPVKPTIQLTADFAPSEPQVQPVAETVVDHPPFGATPVAPPLAAAPAGVVEQSPTAYEYDAVPVMSPEVQAALARAQDEQRLAEQQAQAQRLAEETQRQAEANVAARIAEEVRLRDEMRKREETRLLELQRQEALRLEQERLERDAQMRAEMLRLEQARLEAARAEQERLDRERQEAARFEAIRLETARLEQERADRERREAEAAERVRAEAARLEAEHAEAVRVEVARIEAAREADRVEAVRLEEERAEAARVEAARVEAANIEAASAEAARVDAEKAEAARFEQARLEESRRAVEVADAARLEREKIERENLQRALSGQAPVRDPAEAEKARKADAAAALMRLYSPYGSGALGRPLTPSAVGGRSLDAAPRKDEPLPESQIQPAVSVPPATPRAIETPERSESAPKAADTEPEPAVALQPVSTPQLEPEFEEEEEDGRLSNIFTFTPPGASPSTMPPPQVTALNPYARPISNAGISAAPKPETVVEVPRPAPVDLAASAVAAQPQSAEPLHWREQLQRPLPADYQQQTAPVQPVVEAQPSLLHPTVAAPEAAFAAEADDDWTYDGGRIALSNEEMEEEAVSWWRMIVSTLWWILISAFGLGCLGFAAAAYYRAAYDPTVLRNGTQGDLTILSVIMAAAGIFFVCISVWLIMKRLGGLKD